LPISDLEVQKPRTWIRFLDHIWNIYGPKLVCVRPKRYFKRATWHRCRISWVRGNKPLLIPSCSRVLSRSYSLFLLYLLKKRRKEILYKNWSLVRSTGSRLTGELICLFEISTMLRFLAFHGRYKFRDVFIYF
jgi:hypothetical protein